MYQGLQQQMIRMAVGADGWLLMDLWLQELQALYDHCDACKKMHPVRMHLCLIIIWDSIAVCAAAGQRMLSVFQ